MNGATGAPSGALVGLVHHDPHHPDLWMGQGLVQPDEAGARRLTFGKLFTVTGTVEYISPQQVRGKRGVGRTAPYALGVILYEMLTGETPFGGYNPLAVMQARRARRPSSVRHLVRPSLRDSIA